MDRFTIALGIDAAGIIITNGIVSYYGGYDITKAVNSLNTINSTNGELSYAYGDLVDSNNNIVLKSAYHLRFQEISGGEISVFLMGMPMGHIKSHLLFGDHPYFEFEPTSLGETMGMVREHPTLSCDHIKYKLMDSYMNRHN